jgi:hypothetical protein
LKKITTLPLLSTYVLFLTPASAQTNVSGGIYANTTWTFANSPYIVVDTVVVFPGVTLTIEPGVEVRFDDNKELEIRGTLIANRTVTDSIRFTSNSPSPVPGIWNSIIAGESPSTLFNYCYIEYATSAILGGNSLGGIRNSRFLFNLNGLNGLILTTIDSCDIQFNVGNGVWGIPRLYT